MSIQFIVGKPVPFISYSWYAPSTNHQTREKIYGEEICNAYISTDENSFSNFDNAKEYALRAVNKYNEDSPCPFMRAHCPIFEVHESQIRQVWIAKSLTETLSLSSEYKAYNYTELKQGLIFNNNFFNSVNMSRLGFWSRKQKETAALVTLSLAVGASALAAYALKS